MFELPKVADEDIAWACRVMKLSPTAFSGPTGSDPRALVLKRMETVDVEACPGSGKTTLLVAKLAILARKWTSPTRGMCVLSHTNAARDEIDKRLSATPEGIALTRYPHFIGTIHGFVNEFLALPYLSSIGNPVRTIDDEVTINRRWWKLPQGTRYYLDNKSGGDGRVFLRYEREDFSGTKMDKLGPHTATFKAVSDVCKATSAEGYFCYGELFVWAKRLLGERPSVASDLRARFPLVFEDEVQDNDQGQSSLLHQVFIQGTSPSIRQRFGDSNQAIYSSPGEADAAATDTFPGPEKVDLPNSFRFGPLIGKLADPLGVNPQGLIGLGANDLLPDAPKRVPMIFLFDDTSVESVIGEYARYLTEVFSAEELRDGVFTAVAGVHKGGEEDHLPRRMGHYVPSYDHKLLGRTPKCDRFCGYVISGLCEAQRLGRSGPLMHAVGIAMLELLRHDGNDAPSKNQSNPHLAVIGLIQTDTVRRRYIILLDILLTRATAVTAVHWDGKITKNIKAIAEDITGTAISGADALTFLEWSDPSASSSTSLAAQGNVYTYPKESPQVSVRLGSIHSVKGETHHATLVLESYYFDHHLKVLKPWLLGKRSGGKACNPRMANRLRLHYVAMTRPSHLLCLAMRSDTLSEDEMTTLSERGWAFRKCAKQETSTTELLS
jgi:DNA helicase-2/ATP-dependent DNA helicase PcrA